MYRIAAIVYMIACLGLAPLAMAGDFDMVFYGLTHEYSEKMVDKTLLLNPGDVMGWKDKGSCAIYNTATNSGEIVTIA